MPIPFAFLFGGNMVSEQVEKTVRAIERKCKGPYTLSTEDMDTLKTRWYELRTAGNFQNASLFKQVLEQATGAGYAPIKADDWENLERRVASMIFGHKMNCGQDFNDVILANPLDGNEHTVNCPKCGIQIQYVAPLFSTE